MIEITFVIIFPKQCPVFCRISFCLHSAGWWRSLYSKIHREDHSGTLHSKISWPIWRHWDCPWRPEHLARLG